MCLRYQHVFCSGHVAAVDCSRLSHQPLATKELMQRFLLLMKREGIKHHCYR